MIKTTELSAHNRSLTGLSTHDKNLAESSTHDKDLDQLSADDRDLVDLSSHYRDLTEVRLCCNLDEKLSFNVCGWSPSLQSQKIYLNTHCPTQHMKWLKNKQCMLQFVHYKALSFKPLNHDKKCWLLRSLCTSMVYLFSLSTV